MNIHTNSIMVVVPGMLYLQELQRGWVWAAHAIILLWCVINVHVINTKNASWLQEEKTIAACHSFSFFEKPLHFAPL